MSSNRRYDIDWIRVIVFDILILYHIGMFFVPWDWEIKNNELVEWIQWPMIFINRWRLSILFVISGMGTRFALSERNVGAFLKERIVRLFVPLVAGILLIIAPQIYFVRLSQGEVYSFILQFYPDFFHGIYPEGNFSWAHLWFLPYLLVITVISIPVLVYLRQKDNQLVQRLKVVMQNHPKVLNAFMVPLLIVELFMQPYFPVNHSLWGDWYALTHYLICFLSGYTLVCLKDEFWKSVTSIRYTSLIVGVVSFTTLLIIWQHGSNAYVIGLVSSLNQWSWILAIFGFSSRYLNRPSKILTYRNMAVYPTYILHQTLIIWIGYHLMNSPLAVFWKFVILLCGTLLGCWLIYELLIKRIKFLRPLFGLKS